MHESSLECSCHLRLTLNTTQTCDSAFRLKMTTDHTACVSNTLIPKLLIKQTNTINLEAIINELFQISIDRRFKYRHNGDRSQSIHRHHRAIFNECRAQEAKERQT